jgi:hypothetical protein
MAPATRLSLLLLAGLLAGCAEWPWEEAPRPAAQPAAVIRGPALVVTAPRAAVLVPTQPDGPRRLWRGEGGVALATEGARIVAAAGFGGILMATRFDSPDPLANPRALLSAPAAARRQVDLSAENRDPASMRFGVVVECTLSARREGAAIAVEERCQAGGVEFGNRFLLAETGAPIRSEQWIGDAVPPLVIQHRDR